MFYLITSSKTNLMKGIILYKGKYGATRQYAERLDSRCIAMAGCLHPKQLLTQTLGDAADVVVIVPAVRCMQAG